MTKIYSPPPISHPPRGRYSPKGIYPQSSGYGPSYDPEDPEVNGFDFTDESIRKGFIRKVYSILMCQLLITLGVIALFMYHMPTQVWVREHPEAFWFAFIVTLVTILPMACCSHLRRKTPINFIFLAIFTLAMAFILGLFTAKFKSEEVLIAVGITVAMCFSLTLFAFQTKWDFTVLGGALVIALIAFIIFGIVAILVPGKIMTLIYSSLGAFLFSIYLIYDTQLMMGGDHKYSISPEEYIFAALNLYLDIIQIFMYVLKIIAEARN